MSFQGQLLKAGIWSDGKSIDFFHDDGTFTVKGDMVVEGSVTYTSVTEETVLLQLGTEAAKIALDTGQHIIDAWATSDDTSGTIIPVSIDFTQTGASTTTIIEALRVNIESAVRTGTWANAIVGRINYTAPGDAGGGMAAAVCAEVSMPAKTMGGGTYTLIHGYLDIPTSCVLEDSTAHVVSFLRLESGGGAVTEFDDHGFLMQVVGLTGAADDLISLTSQTAKVLIGSNTRYMILSQMQDGLGLGTSGTPMVLTTSLRAAEIYTKSVAKSGTQYSAIFDYTHDPGEDSSTIIEVLRVNLDSEYQTGSWANAIVGRINYGTAGDAGGGMAAAVCAEMNMPTKSMTSTGGNYYSFDAEMNVPTSCVLQDSTTRFAAFMNFGAWGGAVGEFDDHGYFFHTDGLAALAGHLLSAQSQTLKCNIEGSERFLVLSTAENSLTLSGGAIGVDLGDCTTIAIRAISQTQAVAQIVSAVTLAADTNVVSISASSAANANFEMRALYVQAYPSTAAQATAGLVAGRFEADVANALNTDYMKAIYALMDCSEASTIATGSAAVHADVNVAANTTISANALSAVWAQVRGVATLTNNLYGIEVDLDMNVDTGIDFDVATDKTCTTGIEIGATGSGKYTDGILISAPCDDNGIEIIGVCTGAAFLTSGASTKAFEASSIACASGNYGMSVVSTLTSGASDGIAAYFEGHVAGTPTGNDFAVGAWLNIDGVTGGYNMRALDVGIWTDQDLGSAGTIYGMNIGIHLGSAGAPSVAYQMRFNHSGHALTAWWHASDSGAVAWTGGTDTGATKTGDLAVQIGGIVHYIRTWDGIA